MFLKLTKLDKFGKKKRKKNIDLNPNIIFYQGEVYRDLGKKKATAFKYELPTTLLLLYSVGIPDVTHLHIWAQTVI